MIISLNFTCRDFNATLKQDAVIRANLKIASWQKKKNSKFCRDIKFIVATFSTLVGTGHPLVVKANFSSMC